MGKFLGLFLTLTSVGSVVFAGPNNPLIEIKKYPTFNAIEISSDDIRNWGEPPVLEQKSKNYNSIKSNTAGVMMPGSWDLNLSTTKGISGFFIHPQFMVRLNDKAREWNKPTPRRPINIDLPGFIIILEKKGEFRYAIKEQGIKRIREAGGSISISAPSFQLVVNDVDRRILFIEEPDPEFLNPHDRD